MGRSSAIVQMDYGRRSARAIPLRGHQLKRNFALQKAHRKKRLKDKWTCISLALNQGYGWASEVNLSFIFDRLFGGEFGAGYPVEREIAQKQYRTKLTDLSDATHRPLPEIIDKLPDDFLLPAVAFDCGSR